MRSPELMSEIEGPIEREMRVIQSPQPPQLAKVRLAEVGG